MSPFRKKSELTKVFRASFVTNLGVLCFKDTKESASMVKAQQVEEGRPVCSDPTAWVWSWLAASWGCAAPPGPHLANL